MEKSVDALVELQGRVQALEVALTTLLTVLPNPAELRDAIRYLADQSARVLPDTPATADFRRGWESTLELLLRDYSEPAGSSSNSD